MNSIAEPIPARRGSLDFDVRMTIILRDNRTCTYCGGGSESYRLGPDGHAWHIDHKVPVSEGGTNDPDNLALACRRCNLSKGTARADEPWGRAGDRVTRQRERIRATMNAFYARRGTWPILEELAAETRLSPRVVRQVLGTMIRAGQVYTRTVQAPPTKGRRPVGYTVVRQ